MKPANLNQIQKTERTVVFTLSAWAALVSIASYYGLFRTIPLPTIAFLVVVGIATPLMVYYRNQAFRDYISSIHPKNLVILHVWRILAGFVFLDYGSRHLLPDRFAINAGYGDLAVGFVVPVVLVLNDGIRKYIAFHIFGLLDFVVAVGTGLTFTLLQVPLMENIAIFPIVLIPLFGVPISGASSVMAIDSVWKGRRATLAPH